MLTVTLSKKFGMALRVATIGDVIDILASAERCGAEADTPEGVRYIKMSDTLAQAIIKTLVKERKRLGGEQVASRVIIDGKLQ